MREQTPKILRLACLVLAALLAYQLVHIVPRVNILGRVAIPQLPTLETNAAPANVIVAKEMKPPTNAPAVTNVAMHATQTNGSPTNVVANTNTVAPTNALVEAAAPTMAVPTNTVPVPMTGSTNEPMAATNSTNISNTNLMAGTNKHHRVIQGTNEIAVNSNMPTNAAAAKPKGRRGGGMPPGMMMMGGMGMGAPMPELPADIKARADRIFDSEILAPAMRPLPMGLLGIAGDVAFLRSASGQTGMVKEGDSLGDLKLVHIGINRVLVEQDGEKKELMIFDGYGGTSLLPEKGKKPE